MTIQKKWITAECVLLCALLVLPGVLCAQQVQTGSGALATRVAPGESLPLAITLSNFGSGSNNRVDVTISYTIVDAQGTTVLSQTETVAVQTSASYIKQISLPSTIAPGLYTARTSIVYSGQQAPATASEQFTVEQKIFGIFVSDAILYASILCGVSILCIFAGVLLRRRKRAALFAPHDYSSIPQDVRVYYEILSDAIQQMRYHKGDQAVAIAAKTPGLTIDTTTGKVLAIGQDPSEVIASVVSQYEKTFGKKLNFAFASKERGHAIVR